MAVAAVAFPTLIAYNPPPSSTFLNPAAALIEKVESFLAADT